MNKIDGQNGLSILHKKKKSVLAEINFWFQNFWFQKISKLLISKDFKTFDFKRFYSENRSLFFSIRFIQNLWLSNKTYCCYKQVSDALFSIFALFVSSLGNFLDRCITGWMSYDMIAGRAHSLALHLSLDQKYNCFFFLAGVVMLFSIFQTHWIVCICIQSNSTFFLRKFANVSIRSLYLGWCFLWKRVNPQRDSNSFLFLGMDISDLFLISLSSGDIQSFEIWYPKYEAVNFLDCSHLCLFMVMPTSAYFEIFSVLSFSNSLVDVTTYTLSLRYYDIFIFLSKFFSIAFLKM